MPNCFQISSQFIINISFVSMPVSCTLFNGSSGKHSLANTVGFCLQILQLLSCSLNGGNCFFSTIFTANFNASLSFSLTLQVHSEGSISCQVAILRCFPIQ